MIATSLAHVVGVGVVSCFSLCRPDSVQMDVARASRRTLYTEDGIGRNDIAIMVWRTAQDRLTAHTAIIGRTYIVITA